MVQKLAELQGAVTAARAQTIEKETLYQQLAAVQSSTEALDTLPVVASNSFIQGLKAQLAGSRAPTSES